MIAPLGLVGIALAAWGWAIGLPALGIGIGIAFEALRLMRLQVKLSDLAIARLLRITFIVVLGAFALSIAMLRAPQSLYAWLRWLPVFVLPIPFLQVACGGLHVGALRQSLRFGGAPLPPDARTWDGTHAYALCCLVAAGTAGAAEPWYYAAAASLIAWALIARMRERRVAGVALIACATLLGLGVSTGLYRLQTQLEEWGDELIDEMLMNQSDPFRERTRIGDMGKIKLSDRILMRVVPEGPRPGEILLRDASFDRYRKGTWESSRTVLKPVARADDRWRLRPTDGVARVVVRRSFPRGEGTLPLPPNTTSIAELEASTVETSDAGTVRARGIHGAVAMRIAYDTAPEDAVAVSGVDREVPEALQPVLEQIVAANGLRAASAADSVKAVYGFFARGFSYSLQLWSSHSRGAPRDLTEFLLDDHQGHCEYFATATVLLLRQAGIPARYVVGYSAQEFSALEKAFLVRNRHAHAWAVALVDGHWVTVDTTPATWAEQEAEAARSPLGALFDVFSWAWEMAQRFWAATSVADMAGVAAGIVVLALGPWLLRRIPRRRPATARALALDRVRSAWQELEARARASGHARLAGETVRQWMARLMREAPSAPWRAPLAELAADYYRCVFDPECPADLPERFIARARAWSAA